MDRLDDALQTYYEKFGENYPISVVDNREDEEIINDIRECVLNNEPAKDPELDGDLKY